MSATGTKEQQYNACLDIVRERGFNRLGLMSNQVWEEDPKRLVFVLARYKFVAKMLAGKERVMEVGCSDGFASRIVRQSVKNLTAVDFDPLFIEDAKTTRSEAWPIDFAVHDLLQGPVAGGPFDAAYAMDVLEHIDSAREDDFLRNWCASLAPDAVSIIGIPSLESQAYASPQSKEGHVNCKTGVDFQKTLERWFGQVFLFSMNDEVVHTGFAKMAHYLIGVCVGIRR